MNALHHSSLLSPSAMDIARENFRQAVSTVLAAEVELTCINNRIIHDPDGCRGAAQEKLIIRGQCVIEVQFELATGVKLGDLKKAMGW